MLGMTWGDISPWIFYDMGLPLLLVAAAAYLLGGALGCDVYVANLFASLFAAAYAEVMARVRKCPAMPYLVIAILPLLPGAGVYYTMSLGLEGNRMDAVAKGLETVGIAGSLAVGILLVSTPHLPPCPGSAGGEVLIR